MEEYDLDQREEDLTLLIHAWPDIEEALIKEAKSSVTERELADALRQAFRVEIEEEEGAFGSREFRYVLLFDVNSYTARQAAATVKKRSYALNLLSYKHAPLQGPDAEIAVRVVPSGKPISGEVCPRVMASPVAEPDLQDLPEPEPPPSDTRYVERGHHRLTPIEAPFYDALMKTKLVFAVQPRVQGPDRVYRPDFIVFYDGRGVVVELDGHEGHKTKEQRNDDSKRERWFQSKGLTVIRWTGSQVYADPDVCVQQLLVILRGKTARP